MAARLHQLVLIPVIVSLLSACGGTPTPGPELLGSNASPTAPAAVPTNTPTATQAPLPSATATVAVTLPPAAPMAGLVYQVGGKGLWIVGADGQAKQLSDKAAPVLSPDQTKVLFSQDGDIWTTDLSKGKTARLTYTNDKAEAYYQWWPARPDIIVFQYQFKNDLGPGAGYLATVKTNGANYLLLDEETGSISPAALSPDGQSIAYDRGGQPWVYNFTGGNMPIFPKTFAEKFRIATNPAWSPGSRKIAWQLFGDQAGTDGWSAAAVLNLDTFEVTLLHRYTILGGSDVGNYHLAWSPDGNWLAVANQAERAEDGKISLWVMRPDGSEEHRIGAGDRPVWGPDSQALIYSANNGTYAVKTGAWNPFAVTLPDNALVTDWVTLK
jgi:Tol biopolymer transport system component